MLVFFMKALVGNINTLESIIGKRKFNKNKMCLRRTFPLKLD